MINTQLLNDILKKAEAARASAKTPLAVFDLDGTLFHYHKRVRNILMDAMKGKDNQFPGARVLIENIPESEYEYLVLDTLKKYDIDMPGLREYIYNFWERWFFDNKYLKYDKPVSGAVVFVNKLADKGIKIVYLTGRDVPRMGKGTEEALIQNGFPMQPEKAVLMLKLKYEDDNWEHKNTSIKAIKELGEVVAAFDNEPGEVNILADNFPDAVVGLIISLHSPNAPEPRESVLRLHDFSDSQNGI